MIARGLVARLLANWVYNPLDHCYRKGRTLDVRFQQGNRSFALPPTE